MRRGGASVLVLFCVCLGGCLSGDQASSSRFLSRLHSPRSLLGPDGVLLEIVVVERTLGDPFLNDELWSSTDLQVAGLEKRGILEDNGFRVGQVIGLNSAKLQNLLDPDGRYYVAGRQQILPAGASTSVALGPTLPECNFRLKIKNGADVILDQGQCTLAIVPTLTNDGRTRLQFTPQILYGSPLPDYQVDADRRNITYQCKRPSKTYDALTWEVTLAPNQYLVIGTHFDENAPDDEPQSLGNQCFLVESERALTQRILVIRTARGPGLQESKKSGQAFEAQVQGGVGSAPPNDSAQSQPVSPAALCMLPNQGN